MRIAELAELAGTSPRMLRYYEQEGLLSPARSANGYRWYDDEDTRTARQIVSLADAGLPLEVVRAVLPCASPGGDRLRACPAVAPALRGQLASIRRRISVLTESADAVENYLSRLEPEGPRDEVDQP